MTALRSGADMLDGLCGGDDGDALVLTAQAMQMFVAGDDQIGPSGQGARENVVVVGIVLDYARCTRRGCVTVL